MTSTASSCLRLRPLLALACLVLAACSDSESSPGSSGDGEDGGSEGSDADDDAEPSGGSGGEPGEPEPGEPEPGPPAPAGGDGGERPTGDGGSSGSGSGPVAAGDGLCGAAEGQWFDASHPWNQPIADAPLDAESDAIIAYLHDNHTGSQRFRIDGPSDTPDSLYGITVLTADEGSERVDFEETGDFYSPDCDHVPVPLPAGGAIEGEQSYACDNDGDCHLIVVDPDECRLYEMWRANRSGVSFEGGCLAVWDLTTPYDANLRGDCCTSADAAGLPIAAHLFNADELAAGVIRHAIRFILPNALMRDRVYVRPATHSTSATSGPDDAPPYGSRLRVRADIDLERFNAAAQVVVRALQTYGMILSDGGNLTFTAANDRFTENKWVDVGLGPNDLTGLDWTDFEVVDLGERFVWDDACSCDRQPLED